MRIPRQLLLPTLGLVAWCLPVVAMAGTITVSNSSDSGAGSLRDAIGSANDGDTVLIPGTVSTITLTSGEIQILKSITIQGAGAGTTIIDGNANDRIFEVGDGSATNSVRIVGVTVQNGSTTGNGGGILLDRVSSLLLEDSHIGPTNSAGGSGGGVASSGAGFLTVVRSTIDGNHADGNGGGVSCDDATVDLIDTTVSNNDADSDGGGVANEFCSLTIRGTAIGAAGCNITKNTSNNSEGGGVECDSAETLIDTCTISGNTANGGDGGGGVNNDDSVVIVNSVISGNHAIGGSTGGGGIYNGDFMHVDNTTIANNDTTGDGGGYINFDASIITNTTISGNHADGNGGGLLSDDPLDISNVTIFGNDANGSGGGIYNEDDDLHLNNVTIANNTADKDGDGNGDGGGIGGSASMGVRNTIVAGNFDNSPSGPVDKDCSTTASLIIISEGHNLIGTVDADCVISGDATGNITNQASGLDPSGLQANGSSGPMTVALLSGSLAIDAGDTETATSADERGVSRPQGPASDIGAYEFAVTPVIPTPVPTPTPVPPTPLISGSGCSLATSGEFGGFGMMGLLPLTALGFIALRRRAG